MSGPSTVTGFFHEYVHSLFDGIRKVHPTKRRRGGEDGNVTGPKTVDRVSIRVESHEFTFFRDVQPIRMIRVEMVVASFQLIHEGVRHGHQLQLNAGNGKRICGGTRPSPTAAD